MHLPALILIMLCAQAEWAEHAAEGPSPRYSHNAVWDAKEQRMIVFGGETNPEMKMFGELWAYGPEQDAWTQIESKGKPPCARAYASCAFDAKSRRLWIFGGFSPKFLDDLWSFDLEKRTWNSHSPKGPAPEARDGAVLLFDEKKEQLVLVGGLKSLGAGGELKDVWTYSIKQGAWAKRKDGPAGRFLASSVFIPETRRLILSGGWTLGSSGVLCDVWHYDVDKDVWVEKKKAPGPRAAAGAAWDAATKRMLVYGGTAGKGDYDDVFEYDPAADAWKEIEASKERPAARGYAQCVLDPESRRLIVWGGVVGGFFGKNADAKTWILTLGAAKQQR